MKIALFTICNDSYAEGCLTMIYSFMRNNPDLDTDFIILHDEGKYCRLGKDTMVKISSLSKNIRFEKIDSNKYEKAISNLRNNGMKGMHNEGNIYKYEMFKYDTSKYDYCIFCDSDMIHLSGIDFNDFPDDDCFLGFCEEGSYDIDSTFKIDDIIFGNSGFMVYRNRLNSDFHADIIKFSENVRYDDIMAIKGNSFACYEQDVISVYGGKINKYIIPSKYNIFKFKFSDDNTSVITTEKVIHYVGKKPLFSKRGEMGFSYIERYWWFYNENMHEIIDKELVR